MDNNITFARVFLLCATILVQGLAACSDAEGPRNGPAVPGQSELLPVASDSQAVARDEQRSEATANSSTSAIANDAIPSIGELVLELRIGRLDGLEHEIFGAISGLAVNAVGEVYVFDRQVPVLRKYASDGSYLGTIGREGAGPGEYRITDDGLAVLSDGRLVLRDSNNGRFSVYDSQGSFADSWPSARGVMSGRHLVPTADGGFFSFLPRPGAIPGLDPEGTYVVRYDSGGIPADTISFAVPRVEGPRVRVQNSTIMMSSPAPFAAGSIWSLNSEGEVLSAMTDEYRVRWHRRDGSTVDLTRDIEPVAISPAEREALQEEFVANLRVVDPSWTGRPPLIPEIKPYLEEIYPAEDGRIWIRVHTSGERRPEARQTPQTLPGDRLLSQSELLSLDLSTRQFSDPVIFDVFEADGSFLGSIRAPEEFMVSPRPIFGVNHVWAVTRDELDVQAIARFRIDAPWH